MRKQKESNASGNEYISPYCFARVDLTKVHYM